jgi:hypothetical protein
MFGLLNPRDVRLPVSQTTAHRAYYCGLCQATGQHFGQLYRPIHSHDAVFLATLADGLAATPAEPDSCRCPMLPVLTKNTASPNSHALRYAAAVQMLLADQWLADKEVEGSRLGSMARPLVPASSAWSMLDTLGVDLTSLKGFEGAQGRVERDGATAEAAAAPTVRALGLVFGGIRDLPGVEGDEALLTELGENLGRIIYFIDALEDVTADVRAGAFNPLVVDGEVVPARVERTVSSLRSALTEAAAALTALPVQRNRLLLEATVCQELPRRAAAAIEAGRTEATESAARALVSYRQASPWLRLVWSMASLALLFWTTTVGVAQAAIPSARRFFTPQTRSPCDSCCDSCCDKCTDGCKDSCPCGDVCHQCGDSCHQCGDVCNSCPCS